MTFPLTIWGRAQIRKTRLTQATANVLLAIAERARGNTFTMWAGIECLARDTGASERTVQRAVAALEGEGLIRCLSNRKGGAGKVPTYQLVIPRYWVEEWREKSRRRGHKDWAEFGSAVAYFQDAQTVANGKQNGSNCYHLAPEKGDKLTPFKGDKLAPELLKKENPKNTLSTREIARAQEGLERDQMEASEPTTQPPVKLEETIAGKERLAGPVPHNAADAEREAPADQASTSNIPTNQPARSTKAAGKAPPPPRDPIADQIADAESAIRQIRAIIPDEANENRRKGEEAYAAEIARLAAAKMPITGNVLVLQQSQIRAAAADVAVEGTFGVVQADQGVTAAAALGKAPGAWNHHLTDQQRTGT